MTNVQQMRTILNLCEDDDLRRSRRRDVDEIYKGVVNNYKSEYFEAMQADKRLPKHIKASKKHTGNVVDQAISDLVNQVAYEYSVDAQTAEDIAFDSTLELAGGTNKVDSKGNLHVTNLYIMMDDDLRNEVIKTTKASSDLLGRLFDK